MNITSDYTYTLITPLSDFIGIDSSTIWLIMISVVAITSLLFIYRLTMSWAMSFIAGIIPFVFGIMMGFLPIWMIVIVILPFVYVIWYSPSFPNSDNTDYWSEYGKNMKLAYSAKFGGDNSGFNDEVDKRINIMQNCKNGFTTEIAHGWLKRMARFTEMK